MLKTSMLLLVAVLISSSAGIAAAWCRRSRGLRDRRLGHDGATRQFFRATGRVAGAVLALLVAAPGAAAQSYISGWGWQVFDSRWNQESFVEVAAGEWHTVARRSDGSVVAWGNNGDGQCYVPGSAFGSELRRGCWGRVAYRGADQRRLGRSLGEQLLGPVQRPGAAARSELRRGRGGLGSYLGTAQRRHGDRLREQQLRPVRCPRAACGRELCRSRCGRVALGGAAQRRRSRGVGENGSGQCNVPVTPAGVSYVQVAAGTYHTVARCSDGAVIAWGANGCGSATPLSAIPRLELRRDRSWQRSHGGAAERRFDCRVGDNGSGQCTLPRRPRG